MMQENDKQEAIHSQPCNCCCIETLYTILDGEATEEETLQIVGHIEKCLPCYQQYDLEVSIRELLKNRLEKKTPPQDLIDAIRAKIAMIA
jgi:anti-sigma factor (TIGR02949 family)